MKSLLSAERIVRKQAETLLLDSVSFDVRSGDRIGLVGPTGSGKSLLLRSLAILEPMHSGRVLWKGAEIQTKDVNRFRSQVVYVHQRPGVYEGSVESVFRRPFQLRVHRGKRFDRDWTLERLAEIGRDESFLLRSYASLSGGESQVVALLRAISLFPTVLLLDEPTSALDPQSSNAVEDMVGRWFGRDPETHAFVWVSHDRQQADRVCDRVCQMNQGRFSEDGG